MYTLSLDKNERRTLLSALTEKRKSEALDDLPTDTANCIIERILASHPRRFLLDHFHKRYIVDFNALEKKLIVDSLCDVIYSNGDEAGANKALMRRFLTAERKERL